MEKPTSIFKGTKTWTRRDPALPPSSQKKWNALNRQKMKAHRVVARALRDGTLKRGACELCGSLRVDGHHARYDRPLEIRWLCRRHHQLLHAAERRAAV